MKSVIIYASWKLPRKQFLMIGGKKLYLRLQMVNANDLQALSLAKERTGETLLNTLEIP
jgi:hypothetical protein